MNKIIAIILAILVLGSGVAVLVLNSDSEELAVEMSNEEPKEVVEKTEKMEQSVADPADDNRYVEYSEANLASAEGTKRVVFFHAPWCSTCNYFEGQIETSGVPEGVTILKADYDNDTVAKERYDVKIQSTFVLLDDSGEVVETWPFGGDLRSIQDLYDSII